MLDQPSWVRSKTATSALAAAMSHNVPKCPVFEAKRLPKLSAGELSNVAPCGRGQSRSLLWPGKSLAAGSRSVLPKLTAVAASPKPVAMSLSLPS